MKIKQTEKEISFTFPRYQKRINPYDEKGDYGEYDEMGFAGTIDMDYKGKPDQISDFVVMWDGEEEEFRKRCKELQINVSEMEV
jgi:hypothetical protein